MLPLFLIATGVVFVWAKDLFGEWTAVLAVLLFTTTPPVLALAGIAYVDFGLGAFLPATLFAFSRWLERATMRRSAVLGAMAGCALLSNYTALVFLPPCLVAILACRVWAAKRTNEPGIKAREIAAGVAVIALAALVVIWAGYRFSLQTLNKTFEKPSQDIAAMRGLPSVVKSVAEGVVALNPPLPAPQFLKGFMGNVQVGKAGYKSYLLGRMRNGGWWYFYFVVLALKTPLSLLILAGAGGFFVIRSAIPGHDWKALVPLAGALVVLLASIPIKVNLGIRHILFIYPLLAIIGAYGIQRLWTLRSKWPKTIPAIVIALVAWQVVASVRARPDYISYMNELAPKQRDQALVLGCDFDCGQDLWRLSDALRARQIGHVHLKVWTSTDLASWDLPAFDVLAPNQPATGWVAVSSLYLRMGELTAGPKLATAYAWLGDYKPVDHVGRTIQLYYIPEKNPPPAASPKQ